jgi:flagella basal body P-ring formation protein FlgA
MILPALLALCAASPTARGLRAEVAATYSKLETASMRLSPDTGLVEDTLAGPPDATSWELFRDGGKRPSGTETIAVSWKRADGSSLRRDWLRVRIHRTEHLPIALSRMDRGQTPADSCLRWQWRETSGRTDPPPDSSALAGMRLKTGIGPGQILTSRQLEPRPLVVPGQRILVRSARSGASASVEGVAQENGSAGSRILVLSPWGRRIRCRIQPDGSALSLE